MENNTSLIVGAVTFVGFTVAAPILVPAVVGAFGFSSAGKLS